MKTFPETTLKKILEVANLEPENKGDYFRVICPSCGHKEAFVYKNNRIIACSRKNKCNFIQDVIDYAKQEGKIRKEILKSLSPQVERKEEVKEKTELVIPEGLTFFSDKKDGIMYNKAYSYARSRMIPETYIQQLGYVYTPGDDLELGLFIPFFENEELVYYIVRNIDSKSKKRYENPRGINASNFLYNYDNFRENDTICITEGVIDALSVENFVGTAMLTSSLSNQQASKIFDKAPKRIIYIPDNDETGKGFINKNIKKLIRYKPPSLQTEFLIYYIPDGYKDFNEYVCDGGSGFIDIKNCINYFDLKKNIEIKRKSPF